jgi:hypothetical protein
MRLMWRWLQLPAAAPDCRADAVTASCRVGGRLNTERLAWVVLLVAADITAAFMVHAAAALHVRLLWRSAAAQLRPRTSTSNRRQRSAPRRKTARAAANTQRHKRPRRLADVL